MDVATHDGALVGGSPTGLLPCGVAGEQLLLLRDNAGAVEGVLLPGAWRSGLGSGATTNLTLRRNHHGGDGAAPGGVDVLAGTPAHRAEGALSGV